MSQLITHFLFYRNNHSNNWYSSRVCKILCDSSYWTLIKQTVYYNCHNLFQRRNRSLLSIVASSCACYYSVYCLICVRCRPCILDDDCVTGLLLYTYIEDNCYCCTNEEVLSTNTFVYNEKIRIYSVLFYSVGTNIKFLGIESQPHTNKLKS